MTGIRLLVDGMDKRTQVVDGVAGAPADFETDAAHKEFFHILPSNVREVVNYNVELQMLPGATEEFKLRGIGQFSIFNKVVANTTGWKLELFRDNDFATKFAEFEG